MELSNALRAIRSLTDLPEARRRYLAARAADARTDAERARLVFLARDEDRRVRENLEAALKADHAARRVHAQAMADRPVQAPQMASRRIERTEGTTPEHRPVVVSWTTPTKVAPAEEIGPKPLFPAHKVYDGKPTVFVVPEHGTLRRYQNPHACRCEKCRASKSAANRRDREKRAARRAGTEA